MRRERNLKSFGVFHRDRLFVEKRRAELSNESDNTKKWKKMQENIECGWSEFRGNNELMDIYVKYCTGRDE